MSQVVISAADLRAWRLAQQGLLAPARDAVAAVAQTVGVQAQSPIMAELNIALRVPGLTAAQLKQAYQQHELVRVWANRWTLQLLTKRDWQLLINARQNVKLPAAYFLGERELVLQAVQTVESVLTQRPSLTRAEYRAVLTEVLPARPRPQNFDYAVLQVLASRGVLYLAGEASQQNFILVAAPDFVKMPVATALRQLIKRYLAGFGPATLTDFVKWAGLKIGEVRPVWQQLQTQLTSIAVGDTILWSLTPPAKQQLTVWRKQLQESTVIAARFDASMTGYADKSWLMDEPTVARMWSKNGILMAPIIVAGTVVGKWSYRIAGRKVHFKVEQWGPIVQQQLREQLLLVANYLEKEAVFD